ncbi:MAG: hypothetical protein E2O46_06305 [Ignavibacteria bacterium]|nr:MAG: hypothetical protein E2O46_06305 [Ignavibacteria bacterium]
MSLIYFLYFLIVTPVFNPPADWDAYINEKWGGTYNPFIHLDLGYGFPGQESFVSTFSSIGTVDLKMGYTTYDKSQSYVYKLDEKYLFGKYASSDMGEKINPLTDIDESAINTTSWSFGVGEKVGYGWKVGPFSLIPFNQNQLVLSGLRFTYPNSILQSDAEFLKRLEGDTRFGVSTEGGAEFYVARAIAVTASFEGTVVFPRFVFVQWLGSYAAQSISNTLVSYFSESIVKSSPLLGPIMYLILKNAISFAWYYAIKREQYWPLPSETPFTMETIKISASITF